MKDAPFVHSQFPCDRCGHLEDCLPLLRRLSEAVAWEHAHHADYEPPIVNVDCERRFSPPSRLKRLRIV